jgi:D-hexose-6-phosphate mutarotase
MDSQDTIKAFEVSGTAAFQHVRRHQIRPNHHPSVRFWRPWPKVRDRIDDLTDLDS